MIKKNLDLIVVALIMLSIVLWETTFEMFGELLHLLFELLHTVFEWVELGVEGVVERIFHMLHIGDAVEFLFITERHGAQVVTFYILMAMLGFGLFKLSIFIPGLYEQLRRFLLISWIRRKTQLQLHWRSLTQLHKAAVFATAVGVLVLASFFVI